MVQSVSQFRPEYFCSMKNVERSADWSGVRDSNPFRWLGKPGHNPYTNPA